MKVYFYSQTPCFLKVNCNYVGIVDKNYTYLHLNGTELLEFTPTCNSYYTYMVSIENEEFKRFNFYDGYLFIPKFVKIRNLPYKIISCKTYYDKYTLTIFTDGSIKFYLSGPFTITDELPFLPSDCEVKINGNFIYIVLKANKIAVFVYSINGLLCYKNIVNQFNLEDNFVVNIIEDKILPLNYQITYTESQPFEIKNSILLTTNISEKFIPYAFMNNLLYGASITSFLHENLTAREEDLINFIGKFNCILPSLDGDFTKIPYLTINGVKFVKFIILDGKITNVFIDD